MSLEARSGFTLNELLVVIATAFLLGALLSVKAADTLDQWRPPSSVPTIPILLRAVHYGDGQWIAGGDSRQYLISRDAVTWRALTNRYVFTSVSHAKGTWVAVGYDGSLRSSPDGTNWTELRPIGSSPLYAVAYAASLWVAVGSNGTILTSSDGLAWTTRNSGEASLRAVCFGGSRWVAAGEMIVTSEDGITWTTQKTATNLNGIAYGNGLWVAVGGDNGPEGVAILKGTILTSSDGFNWTERMSSARSGYSAVAFGGGQFVALRGETGAPSGYAVGAILTSSDGTSWTVRYSTPFALLGVSYVSRLWVSVGTREAILLSGSLTIPPRLSITRSGTNVVVTWPAAASGYILETATNLLESQSWNASGVTPAILNFQNTITNDISPSPRFYRLRQEP